MGTDLLTADEFKLLTRCERTIERGLGTFRDVGAALLEVRENHLYRSDYETFADYCKERWGFDRTYAHRLIAGAKTIENVANCQQILTESQARELGKVPAEKRDAVLDWATEKAGDKPLTAAVIRQAAKEFAEQEPDEDDEDEPLDATSESEPEVEEAAPEPAPAPESPAQLFADELKASVAGLMHRPAYRDLPVCVVAAVLENLATELRQ